jgi:hypothetical protein
MNMISTLRKKINYNLFSLIVFAFLSLLLAQPVQAQESLTLSISPSIFNMSANPGQEWQSTLRVINVNNFDLTVYVDVLNFLPQGDGSGTFVSIQEGDQNGLTIAEWFNINKEAIVVPREQSIEVPFSVRVPMDASPGGHSAAILVGTKPLTPESGQAKVQTSQTITSLFFARVAGDILESGDIREFTTTKTFLSSPEATFELRFENKGNVHLQPQGDIRITNMWGEERGIIPINQNSHFGLVAKEQIRKFTFTWKGEWAISDIGRYTAIATLGYGTDRKQFASSKTIFWVIPFKLLLGIIIFFAIFFAVSTWLVRLYIRHTLAMAGINVDFNGRPVAAKTLNVKYNQRKTIRTHSQFGLEWLSFKNKLKSFNVTGSIVELMKLVAKYKGLLGAIIAFILSLIVIIWYIWSANTAHRGYEVVYVNSDANVTLSSEEIAYNALKADKKPNGIEINPNYPKLKIINRSGIPEVGAKVRLKFEDFGYEVVTLGVELGDSQSKTVIVYSTVNESDALRLSGWLSDALISIDEKAESGTVTIFVGRDAEEK